MQKVSIILPVYRADEYLSQCLDSINKQDYDDIELIVVDDAQGSGVAAARNRGLERAHGEFIAFVDADDYLEPGAIKALVNASDGADLVAGAFRKFGLFEMTVQEGFREMNMPELASYVMDNLKSPRRNQMLSGCWAKLFRREVIGCFPTLLTGEDMAFNFDYLTRCRFSLARFIPDLVYHNRKRKDSLTTTYDEKNPTGLFGVIEALGVVERFLRGYFRDEEIRAATDTAKIYHSILYAQRIGPDALKKLFPL